MVDAIYGIKRQLYEVIILYIVLCILTEIKSVDFICQIETRLHILSYADVGNLRGRGLPPRG